MLRYFFSRSITTIIDSVDNLSFHPGVDVRETLFTFRDAVTNDIMHFDELTDSMTILDDQKDIRLNNAKRGVYLAVIELIDAKIDSLTD